MWSQISIWYLYLLFLGFAFLPLTTRLFRSFVDRGYPFAKTIAIIVVSYVAYLLGIFKLVPFSRETLFFLTVALAFFFYHRWGKEFFEEVKALSPQQLTIIVIEELLFFCSLVALIFVRGQEPSIRGLEKFMDYGFMNSILRSKYFPPLDMWLSADPSKPTGYPINYYYFGHLTGAMLIKLSGVKAAIGYNMILGTILAQGMSLVFSLTGNIVYWFQKYIRKQEKIFYLPIIMFGLLGAYIVNFGGNLHTIYLFTKGYPNDSPVPFWTIFQSWLDITTTMKEHGKGFLDAVVSNSKYWYPNATRFIPFTIHEFPAYSYVVADLHGHVFDIPFVLVTIAFLMLTFLQKLFGHTHIPTEQVAARKGSRQRGARVQANPGGNELLTESGILAFLKNFRVYLSQHLTTETVLYAVIIGFLIAINYMTNAFDGPIYLLLTALLLFALYRLSIAFFFTIGTVVASFYLFSRPFSFFFSPFVSGVGVNCSPEFLVKMQKFGPFLFEKGNCQISEPWMLFVLWGFFWISALLLLGMLLIRSRRIVAPPSPANQIDVLMLLWFAFGTLMIVVPEFFYIKDIYPAHFRANTMFKMGYQAFMLMGMAATYTLYRIKTWPSKLKYGWKVAYLIVLFFVVIYPFFAFPSYYPGLYEEATYRRTPNLDGLQWLTTTYPEDKEIVDYFNENVSGQPIILEAQGDSYTDYERISAYTGLPTVAGWWVHEWLWRGSADVVGKRIPDVVNMYESPNVELTKATLKMYGVTYVVIGSQERTKYPNLNERKFTEIGTKIFQSQNGKGAIYKVY